jgi:hypothetical protein
MAYTGNKTLREMLAYLDKWAENTADGSPEDHEMIRAIRIALSLQFGSISVLQRQNNELLAYIRKLEARPRVGEH